LAELDSELVWESDPKGIYTVNNSDNSITEVQPHEGFSFVTGERVFCPCYEFNDGIAVHPEEQRALEKARTFAIFLGASAFEI
jgi:hypothetical protein